MPSTFLSLHYHVVFSTKERRPLIRAEWSPSLHEYLGGTVRGLLGMPEAIGGIEDHVHLLIGLKATHRLADFVRELKKASSVWSADHHDRLFAWQEGYAAFTVSPTNREAVRAYVGRQAEHHKKLTFEEEIIGLLEKAGVQYDPKYLA
jgi:REP element-mobilizing transposase RayT